MENSEEITIDETRVYEIGYLLSPLVSAEDLAETTEKNLKSLIVGAGGNEVSDLPPRSIRLAYPIKQTVGHKPLIFREAFFGAWRFRLAPEAVPALGDALRASPELIRHLLIEVPPAALAEEKRARIKTKHALPSRVRPAVSAPARPSVMSQAEMDKEIDQLLVTETYVSRYKSDQM